MRGNDSISELIVGLDIGSTKVSMIAANATYSSEGSHLEVLASESVPKSGLLKGTIVDIDATVCAISDCVRSLEEKCGVSIRSALVGISGDHVRSYDSKTTVLIHDSEIDKTDIDRLKKEAEVVSVPDKYDVIHVIPKNFSVDEEEGIINPKGMYGNKLEMNAHVVASRSTAIKNIIKCCNKANLKVSSLVLSGLASGISVLGEDEKQLGVALVDVGGGSCKIVIYHRGMLVQTAFIPVGGIDLTNDIAVGLRVTQKQAEDLKCKFGFGMPSLINNEKNVELQDQERNKSDSVSNLTLSKIIEPRAEEILSLINNSLKESGFIDNLGSGVVLTGGLSDLNGFTEMMEFLSNMKVRKGIPCYIEGMNDELRKPGYATGMGLVMHGFKTKNRRRGFFMHDTMISAWRKIKNLVST